VSVSVSVSV